MYRIICILVSLALTMENKKNTKKKKKKRTEVYVKKFAFGCSEYFATKSQNLHKNIAIILLYSTSGSLTVKCNNSKVFLFFFFLFCFI